MKRLAGTLLALCAAPALADPVAVDGGLIDGVDLGNGVEVWRGVPFVKPPLRELRWRAPQPVEAWQGTYHADRFAPMCLQSLRGRTMNHYFGNEAISEDCLYLNVWAPAGAEAGRKLPVIVWIYGGGFNVGSASMANYAGENLAKQDVVYVSIAYRVGPLGFLAHPELTAEQGGHSGNYGLMDQIAGLQWIQRNIAAFGGDPNNVTIMGQSAGSMSVSLLQMSPQAKGLFNRVVGMSGSSHRGSMEPIPLAKAEEQGLAVQDALGASSIEAMRDLAGDRVIAGAVGTPRQPIVLDGKILTGTAEEIFAAHQQSDVPVMVGFTRDEGFASLPPVSTVAEYELMIRDTFPQTADDVLAAYPVTSDEGVARAVRDIARDMSVASQMYGWASDNVRYGAAPAYAYFFTRRQPYTAGITFSDHDPATAGAYHTGEVPYFLDNLQSLNLFRQTRDWNDLDRDLRDAMSGMILSFARSGVPAADWPKFDPADPKAMMLGEDIEVIDWPNAAALSLLVPVQAPARARRPGDAAQPRD